MVYKIYNFSNNNDYRMDNHSSNTKCDNSNNNTTNTDNSGSKKNT